MLDHAVRALELSRAAGDQTLEIMSLNDVGYSHARLGHYGQAIATATAFRAKIRVPDNQLPAVI